MYFSAIIIYYCWLMIRAKLYITMIFSVSNEFQYPKYIPTFPCYRPFFTYWISFVQTVVLIVGLAVYNFAPIGFTETTREAVVRRVWWTSQELCMYILLTKHEVKIAGYWPSSLFAFLWTETKSRSIKTQKENKANTQPSSPN